MPTGWSAVPGRASLNHQAAEARRPPQKQKAQEEVGTAYTPQRGGARRAWPYIYSFAHRISLRSLRTRAKRALITWHAGHIGKRMPTRRSAVPVRRKVPCMRRRSPPPSTQTHHTQEEAGSERRTYVVRPPSHSRIRGHWRALAVRCAPLTTTYLALRGIGAHTFSRHPRGYNLVFC